MRPLGEARLPARLLADGGPPGCTTTARVRRGAVRWVDRHVARLQRDAAALGLGCVEEFALRAAFRELARAAFRSADGAGGDGAIRLQVVAGDRGRPDLLGFARSLAAGGGDAPAWNAVRARAAHPGPQAWGGAKLSAAPHYALARAEARAAGAQEALLVDARGRLIEGARTNLVAIDARGRWRTPDLARGGVQGLALAVSRERLPELRPRDIGFHELFDRERTRELLAVNAVRGVRPILRVDDRAIGDGRAGPGRARLHDLLESAR